MRKRRPSSDENSPHQGVLVVVSVQAAGMIHLPLLLGILYHELILCDDCPAGLGDNPQWCNAMVVGEVKCGRHVDVAEVDVKVWVGLCLLLELVI